MKKNEMYKGKFKLTSGPYPQLKVCDYPDTPQTLKFLENRVTYLLNQPNKMPEAMKNGLIYKMEHVRTKLKKPLYQFLETQ